jgi:hypothetical protein
MHLLNPAITLQSTSSSAAPVYDISDEVASCTFDVSKPIISRNTFGTSGQQRNKKGRFDGSLTIDFDHDYSTSASISRVLYSYLIADYPVTVVVYQGGTTTATSAAPKYTFAVAVDSLPLFDGDADSGATASVTWPMHGEPAEGTS